MIFWLDGVKNSHNDDLGGKEGKSTNRYMTGKADNAGKRYSL